MKNSLCVVIMTFNSEKTLTAVVESCLPLRPRFVVVDSFSLDGTVELAKSLGCEVLQHPFENYARQRNWAQDAIAASEDWYLHLDSDEVVSPSLCKSIASVLAAETPANDGFLMRRTPYFMGKRIRYGAINPTWHLRLYRVGTGRCEDRKYDQHFVMDGPAGKIDGDLIDLQIISLEQWTASHNRWSTMEAEEVWNSHFSESAIQANQLDAKLFGGDSRMRKRWLKNNVWYRMPLLLRPFLFFFYSYIVKLGFLDGRVGLIHHLLQSFWFRFLVDAKLVEKGHAKEDISALMEQVHKDAMAALAESRE